MENRNVYPVDNHTQEWLETEKKDKSLIRIFSESDRYIRTYFSPSYPRQKHTNQRPEITPFHETEKEKKPEKVRKVREKKKNHTITMIVIVLSRYLSQMVKSVEKYWKKPAGECREFL
ncbi:MAG: hypothetical protein LUE98_12040 [Tannerellaceae bacterium]|nr:hypothetical protein [Tannerellaceae bacterium]